MWATLKKDPVSKAFLAFLVIFHLPYFLPLFSAENWSFFADVYASALFLPFLMLAVFNGLPRLTAASERRFWGLVIFALGVWWVVALINAFAPQAWWGPQIDLTTDSLYALHYLVVLLAAEIKPHLPSRRASNKARRRLETSGTILLLFGMLIYFVVVPRHLDPEAYESWLRSLYLYVALDLLVALRFALLAGETVTRRWRVLYGLLSLSFVLFACMDFLESLTYAEMLLWKPGQKTDLLWNLPMVALVLAARLRHHHFDTDPAAVPAPRNAADELARERTGSPLVASALVFPLMHYGLYSFGVLSTDTKEAREVVVFVALLVLGTMAIIEHAILRRLSAQAARERRRVEELRIAKQIAEQASDAKSEFLAHMSHELRTPLNGVTGMAELLLHSDLQAHQQELVEIQIASADSLLRVIDDILDLSKIEAGKLNLETIELSLREIVNKVIQLHKTAAAARGLELHSTLAEDLPDRFLGDPVRLNQVLHNLVSNAIKFTERGQVEVTVDGVGDGNDGDGIRWLHFSVRDTGIGIGPEALSRLFQSFNQGDNTITRRFGGTGLGLFICKSFVEAMGGEIGVESSPEQGSVFWIDVPLPLAPEPEAAPIEQMAESHQLATITAETAITETTPETEDGIRHRILLAEDNETNRFVTIHQLRSRGYRVDAVDSGLGALTALDRHSYDLVLMDCQMPVLDGYEAARRIRQREPAGEHLPIIAITAHALKEDREKCLAAGMDDFLTKPHSQAMLFQILDRWLPKDLPTDSPTPSIVRARSLTT